MSQEWVDAVERGVPRDEAFVRYYAQIEVHNTVANVLNQQVEMARIDEKYSVPLIHPEEMQKGVDRVLERRASDYEDHYRVGDTESGEQVYLGKHSMVPAKDLSNNEILVEVLTSHAQFEELSKEYKAAGAIDRTELRQQMESLVNREKELRQEFGGRMTQEIRIDRVPEMEVGISV